jgi:hypothetical protein
LAEFDMQVKGALSPGSEQPWQEVDYSLAFLQGHSSVQADAPLRYGLEVQDLQWKKCTICSRK